MDNIFPPFKHYIKMALNETDFPGIIYSNVRLKDMEIIEVLSRNFA